MADFTAKDVQALRQATGAGMMDAKRALQENGGDSEGRRQVAARAGPGQGRRPATVATTRQGAVAVSTTEQRGRDRRAEVRDRLRGQVRPVLARSCRRSPRWSRSKGEDAAQEKADAIDDLKVVLKENIALGPGRPVRGGRRQRRRHLHPPPGRPRRERRASSSSTAARKDLAHDIAVHDRLHQAELPAPRRRPRGRGRRGAGDARVDHPGRGQARGRAGARSSTAGSPAGSRSGCSSSRATSRTRRRRSPSLLGGAKVVRFAQVAIGG